MPPVLFYYDTAPPVRAVLLTIHNIGARVELKFVNLSLKENFSSDFEKMNPAKKVPVLKDGDLYISDSHAINAYLVSKYGRTDELYPTDLKKRAIVDSRLYFENGTLFPILASIVRPRVYDAEKEIPASKMKNAMNVLEIVDRFLENNEWVAGNKMTIADFSFITTLTSLEILVPEVSQFLHIERWLSKCKISIPGYEKANVPGLEKFRMLVTK